MKKMALAMVAAIVCLSSVAGAQEKRAPETAQPDEGLWLSFGDALRLARRSSPAAMATPRRVEEAEATRVDAGIYPRQNPLLELEAGPRLVGENVESAVFSAALTQTFDLGGGVGARTRRADAQVALARADGETAIQHTQRAVALAFVRGLWAEQRRFLANESQRIAKTVHEATKKRVEAGDATALELNVARGGYARALADHTAAEGTVEASKGELRSLLGLTASEPLGLKGALDTALVADGAKAKTGAANRADVRALAADLAAAEADSDLADALAAPQLGVGARYEFEDDRQHTIVGIFSLTLPFFDHGQGLAAVARAKAARAKTELAAKRSAASVEVETAARVAEKRADASKAFDLEKGVESFQDNLNLAMKGYQAGETSLAEVVTVRRELIETEAARIDRLLELRNAEIELMFAGGVLP